MKMVKKVLMGVAAVATMAVFSGCLTDVDGVNWNTYAKDKQNKIAYYAQIAANKTLSGEWYVPGTTFFAGDDEEGAIKGANTKYTVDYENKTDSNYRAYKETAMKHAGAIIRVTFHEADVGTSKMGVIFDLKDDDENDGAKEFYIIGLNPSTSVANFYVSKFSNVTDIQAYNFGTAENASNSAEQNAAVKANPAKEVEIVPLATANNIKTIPEADEEGYINFYVYYKLMADGSFNYAVLDMTDADFKSFNSNKKFNSANIDDYTVLAKGNTAKVGDATKNAAPAEYDAAETSDAE